MKPSLILKLILACLCVAAVSCGTRNKGGVPEVIVLIPETGSELPEDEPVDFVKDVKPILEGKCLACHYRGSDLTGLSFATRSEMLNDELGRSVLVPGKPEKSSLFLVTALPEYFVEAMPPSGHRLSDDERWAIYKWILDGAAWPEGVVLGQSKGELAERLKISEPGA